jgi:gluconolactonase
VAGPDGEVEHIPVDDPLVTNIAFGGADLRTAYVTASATGRLVAGEWPRPGLRLAHT